MPWYDYQCDICTEIFEIEHPMEFTGAVLCPTCESGDVHKLILSCAAIKVRWRDPRSSSDVDGLVPKYMHAVTKRPQRERPKETAHDLEGFIDDAPEGRASASHSP